MSKVSMVSKVSKGRKELWSGQDGNLKRKLIIREITRQNLWGFSIMTLTLLGWFMPGWLLELLVTPMVLRFVMSIRREGLLVFMRPANITSIWKLGAKLYMIS